MILGDGQLAGVPTECQIGVLSADLLKGTQYSARQHIPEFHRPHLVEKRNEAAVGAEHQVRWLG